MTITQGLTITQRYNDHSKAICYPELSRIAVGIHVIAPENASCEHAFSIMQFIINNQRSCLSQLHLDNALHSGLETREPSDFPFEQLFHYIKN